MVVQLVMWLMSSKSRWRFTQARVCESVTPTLVKQGTRHGTKVWVHPHLRCVSEKGKKGSPFLWDRLSSY